MRISSRFGAVGLRLGVFGLLAVMLLAVAAFAPWLAPFDPNAQDLSAALLPPDALHWLGTDRFGRDMLSRILMGLRTSVFSTLALALVISVTGTCMGLFCGWHGGFWGAFLMRVSEICLAFPGLVFALAVAAVLHGGLVNAMFALALICWPKYARIARGLTLSIKSSEFVAAARLSGTGGARMILRHILPNALGPIVVTATLDIGTLLMELAGLSFLGLGAQPPTAELGSMMSSGRSMLQTYPWVVLGPGAVIFLSVVVFNLLGDTLRDALDPRGGRKG